MRTKKIFSLISSFLIITIIITNLFFSTTYADTTDASLNRWIADTITLDDEGKDYYRQFLRLNDPVYVELGEAYISDKSLYRTTNMWSDLLNEEFRHNYIIKEYYLYDMVLMGFMKYESVSKSFITSLENEELEITEQLHSIISDELVNNTADYFSDETTIEQAKEIFDNAEWAETFGEALTIVDFGSTAIENCMDQIACCIALSEKQKDKLELLRASREVAIKEKDLEYVRAVDVIIDAMESINVLDYVGKKGAVQGWGLVLKATEEVIKNKIPVFAIAELSITGMNVLFDSSKTAANDVKLTYFLLCDSYMRTGAIKTAQQYREMPSSVSAGVFLDSFTGYLTFQKYGDDYAKEWIDDYISAREPFFIWIFNRENIKKAKELYDFCDSEMAERDKLLNGVSELYGIYNKSLQKSKEDTRSSEEWDKIPNDGIDNMLSLVNAQVNFFRHADESANHVTSCKNEDDFWNTFGAFCNSNLTGENDTGVVTLQDGAVVISSSEIIDMGYALFDDFEGVIPDTDFYEYGPISYDEDEDVYHFYPASMHDYIYKEKSEPILNDDGTITITYLYEESYWPERDAPETFAYDITFRVNEQVNESSDNPYYYTIISVEDLSGSKKNEVAEDSDDESQTDDEYILPDSDKRLLTEEDIDELDEEMLKLARNEIYARHGRLFNDENIQSYFNTKSWYKGDIPPEEFQQEILSEIEQANAEFILQYENTENDNDVYEHVLSHLHGLWYSNTMGPDGPVSKMLCEGNNFDGEISDIVEYHEGYLVRIVGGYSYYFGKELDSCIFVDGWETTENNTYGTSGYWKPNEEQREEYGD